MTSSTLGLAPIVDFDGTLARLDLAWSDLRARLHVDRITDLWRSNDPHAWSTVTKAETDAAGRAAPVDAMRTALEHSVSFAVLTDNSEKAVARFLARFATLRSRAALVIGRETLAGPKRDYNVFGRGLAKCVAATARARRDGPVVFVGDAEWELRFARGLGAQAVAVREVTGGS